MLIIRNHQIESLVQATRRAVQRDLVRRFAAEHPEQADAADEIVAAAVADAAELEIRDPDVVYRLALLALLPGYPNVPGKWGALLVRALANRLASGDARLTFIERELIPRIRAELSEATS